MPRSEFYKYYHLENKSIQALTAELPIRLICHSFRPIRLIHSDNVSIEYCADAPAQNQVLFGDELNHARVRSEGDSIQTLYSLQNLAQPTSHLK